MRGGASASPLSAKLTAGAKASAVCVSAQERRQRLFVVRKLQWEDSNAEICAAVGNGRRRHFLCAEPAVIGCVHGRHVVAAVRAELSAFRYQREPLGNPIEPAGTSAIRES